MRLVDEKGRFLGKINIIDLLLLLFLLLIVPAFYFGFQSLTKRSQIVQEKSPAAKEFKEVTIQCLFIKLTPEELPKIALGDREVQNRQTIGEIIALGSPSAYQGLEYAFDLGSGQKIEKEVAGLKQLPVTLKVKAEVRQNNLYYKDNILQIDLPFEFSADKYTVAALLQEEKVVLKVKFERLTPEIANQVKAGDQKTHLLNDGSSKVAATVVKVLSNKPMQVPVAKVDSGEWVLLEHPQLNDLVLEIEALCSHANGCWYFEDTPVKIGLSFRFFTDRYYLGPEEFSRIIEIIQ
ncbi:MAG: DUF4330 family protein [Candidatus Omnitrophota bacterium]